MKYLQKIGIFLVIFAFVFQSVSVPISAMSNEEQIKIDDLQLATILLDENEENVPLFEEDSEDSEILTFLQSDEEVVVLEKLDDFSFIEYVENDEQVWQGFISNHFLKLESSDDIKDDSNEDSANDEEDPDVQENESIESSDNEEGSNFSKDESVRDPDEHSTSEKVNTDEEESGMTDSNETEVNTEIDDTEDQKITAASTSLNLTIKATSAQTSLEGIALKNQTSVYAETSTGSKTLKSYPVGSILKYSVDPSLKDWYTTGVYINGVKHPGYIHKSDVENATENQVLLEGIALQTSTSVYTRASTSSNARRTYPAGSILKYYTYSENWYKTGVYINGIKQTGYIHKSHVEDAVEKPVLLEGIALQSSTSVFTRASTSSSTRKSYPAGSVLKYYTYSENWYRTGVYINGKKQTGYIHKSHVENATSNPKFHEGIAKNSTSVYTSASTQSNALRSYPAGSILKYYTYSKDWYRTGVYINGKKQTGYIHKSHVENATENPKFHEGVALESPTRVYTNASTNSKVLRSYPVGSILKFYTYSNDWYRTGVYINGVKQTGYIHKSHVGDGNTHYDITLNEALEIQMTATPQTDNKYAWVSKEFIDKNNKVTASSLNVRPRPGTGTDKSFNPIGTLPKGTTVKVLEEYNGWYAIEYNSNDQWRHARPADVMYYLNPLNFINDSIQRFQFLDLARTSGASKTVLNNYLKGKGILDGQAEAFIEAGRQHGLNDVYLISHAILETGNGTSTLANGVKYNGVTVYNMYGIGAYDSCPVECGAEHAYEEGWTTPAKAIIGGAKFIGNDYVKAGQNTLYKMRWNPAAMESTGRFGKQYATDVGWASKQITTMYNLYQEIGEYTLYLDIPVYK